MFQGPAATTHVPLSLSACVACNNQSAVITGKLTSDTRTHRHTLRLYATLALVVAWVSALGPLLDAVVRGRRALNLLPYGIRLRVDPVKVRHLPEPLLIASYLIIVVFLFT